MRKLLILAICFYQLQGVSVSEETEIDCSVDANGAELPRIVARECNSLSGNESAQRSFYEEAVEVLGACQPRNVGDNEDQCAARNYGMAVGSDERDSAFQANPELASLSGSVCGDGTSSNLAVCKQAEILTFNIGRDRSAAYGAIFSGYVRAGQTQKGQDFLKNDPLFERQLKCAIDQTSFTNGECSRTVSAADIRNDPYYEGDACKYLDDNFYGLCGMREVLALSHATYGALNQCAEQGTPPEQCQLDYNQDEMGFMDEEGKLPEDYDGNILLGSESFLNSMNEVLPERCQGKGLSGCVSALKQNIAGEILPRRIEEEKGMLLYNSDMVSDEQKTALCKSAGEKGVAPPSDAAGCRSAYMEGYTAKNGTTTSDPELMEEGSNSLSEEKLFAFLQSRRDSELNGWGDAGLPELVEIRAGFEAIKAMALLEANNNADLFRRSDIFVGKTPIKVSNVVEQSNQIHGENPQASNYESSFANSNPGGRSSFDSSSSPEIETNSLNGEGGGTVRDSTVAFLSRGNRELDPESPEGMAAQLGVVPGPQNGRDASGMPELQLAEGDGLGFRYTNVEDFTRDYFDLDPDARARSVDTPVLGVYQLIFAEDEDGNSYNMGCITSPCVTCDTGGNQGGGFLGRSSGQSPCGPVRTREDFESTPEQRAF